MEADNKYSYRFLKHVYVLTFTNMVTARNFNVTSDKFNATVVCSS